VTLVTNKAAGIVSRVNGPVVTAAGMLGAQMYEVVAVGQAGLVGEIVRLSEDRATIQVYEDTSMLAPGAPVTRTGAPLSLQLGPGLIGNIYDGIQRSLPGMQALSGPWILRGEKVPPLDVQRRWEFRPRAEIGQAVTEGQVLGEVQETPLITHRIMVPPGVSGTLKSLADPGSYAIEETVAELDTPTGPRKLTMVQRWPLRSPRQIGQRRPISEPLVTGQRIVDTLFPIGKGGTAAIPGGFGTGKTITQHQSAKWSNADLIV